MPIPGNVANLPVIGPWLTMKDQNQNVIPGKQLGQMAQFQTIQNSMQEGQAKQVAAQRDAQMRAALQGLPPDASQDQVAAAVRPFAGANQLLTTATASADRDEQRKQRSFDNEQRIKSQEFQIQERGRNEIARVREAAVQGRITKEEADARESRMRADMIRLAASLRAPAVDTTSEFERLTATLEKMPKNHPNRGYYLARLRKLTDGEGGEYVIPPGAAQRGDEIKPPANLAAATGASGLVQNVVNTAQDMFGYKMNYPDAEKGKQYLINLGVRTKTLLQAAVPGRPSNKMMEELERLTIEPGSLLVGDQRAMERMKSTQNMIQTEVNRIEREIFPNLKNYTASQQGAARQAHGQLREILNEYNMAIKSMAGGPKRDPQGFNRQPENPVPPANDIEERLKKYRDIDG